MTHSQLLFDGDMNEVMKSIAFQIDSEYHIHINIAMSFHSRFCKVDLSSLSRPIPYA